MNDESLPPEMSLRTGYEVRDGSAALIVATAVILALTCAALLALLWGISRRMIPEQAESGASPPVVMPGQPAMNDRIRAIPQPRLDTLEPLEAEPPSYRSSRPLTGEASSKQRPEDLRADRQPALQGFGWIDKGKVARIPIGLAMDAVVEAERPKSSAKKAGAK